MRNTLFIIISLLSIGFILSSSAECPIQFKCSSNNTCYMTETKEQITTVTAKKCPYGEYCNFKGEYSKGECSDNERILYPGFFCTNNTQCISNKCENLTCTGLPEGSQCQTNGYCANGLFCWNGMCTKQIEVDGACTADYDCVNTAACYNGFCRKYLSLPVGTPLQNKGQYPLCETNYAMNYTDGIFRCTNATLESLNYECEDDQDYCDYTVHYNGQNTTTRLLCECSWFNPTRRFCPMGSQNATYINATNDFREYLKSAITKKHTDRRWTFSDYEIRKNFFWNTEFPKFQEATECGYDALLSVNYIKVSFVALFALALLF